MRVTMVTVVHHNEQPGDLKAGEGAHVTLSSLVPGQKYKRSEGGLYSVHCINLANRAFYK